MNYITSILAVLCGIALSACSTDSNGAKLDINPNGSSELALLMREMFEDGMKVKEDVLAGRDAAVNCDYAKIHTATATEPEKVATPAYASFASAYEESVNAFNTANPYNQKEAYTHMVQSCIQCHAEVCPGPIRKIRKMELPKQ